MWVPEPRRSLLTAYATTLQAWNQRLNLISKGAEAQVASHHIPHCLAIAWKAFPVGATVIDWGTGGGLPLIPLAIAFPEVEFVGVDSTAKKVAALRIMIRELGLENASAWQGRAEEYDGRADYFVSRATAPLDKLFKWSRWASGAGWKQPMQTAITVAGDGRGQWSPGLISLKGGQLDREIRHAGKKAAVEKWALQGLIEGATFEDKYILHARLQSKGSERTQKS